MTYEVTADDVKSTTDVEMAFATTRLLPSYELVPKEFKKGNLYTKTVSAIFFGTELPKANLYLNLDVTPEELNKCITAHLKSFEPKHEHKIAGVGYLLSKIATLETDGTTGK